MSDVSVRPEIGGWYRRLDKGELFQVTGRDSASRSIEIQTVDGDVDEIDAPVWATLPLEAAEAPEDWPVVMDDVEVDDLGYSETAMSVADWEEPLQPVRSSKENWEDNTPEDERDPLGEGSPDEEYAQEQPAAAARLS